MSNFTLGLQFLPHFGWKVSQKFNFQLIRSSGLDWWGCWVGWLVLPEFDLLVETDEDAASMMLLVRDKAVILFISSFSQLPKGIKLESGASEVEVVLDY